VLHFSQLYICPRTHELSFAILMLVQVLAGHDGSLTTCIFLPGKGGRRVLSAANDASFRVWDEFGKCVHMVDGMKHTVRCAAVCKALDTVYLGDSSGAIQVLQARDFSFSRTQEGSARRGWVLGLALSCDGQYMTCCYQHGDCIVFDARSGEEVMKIDDDSGAMPLCSAFSGDNHWMCIGYDDGHATMYSVSKHSITRKHTMTVSVQSRVQQPFTRSKSIRTQNETHESVSQALTLYHRVISSALSPPHSIPHTNTLPPAALTALLVCGTLSTAFVVSNWWATQDQ
jgi:WD40 repeat protein